MPKMKRLLTEAEAKILTVLWERPGQTMMEITRALEQETGWSKHTVTTLLKRMMDKGTVRLDDSGPVRRYSPAIGQETVTQLETRALLDRLFGGDAARLVRSLLDDGALTREALAEIAASPDSTKA